MSKMYDCINRCLCAKCTKIEANCAECKYNIGRIKECVTTGIKICEYFEEEIEK